jgi:flagellar biosynthesis protein FlhB
MTGGLLESLRPPLSTAFDIHLQWFAAEDEGRTEEPSEHKIRKAREEGKVAKSGELTSTLVLLVSTVTMAVMAGSILNNCAALVRFFMSFVGRPESISWQAMYRACMGYFIRIALPFCIAAFLAALAGNVAQVGFLFTVKPITPDFSRIVPHIGRWLQRSFLSGEAAFNLAKALVKVAIIVAIVYVNITGEMARIERLVLSPLFSGISLIADIGFRIIVEAGIVMLVISLIDYWFQRRQHMESLKMSKQEVKEERKLYEGDPLVKSRLRERMRDILRKNMMQQVPKATVIITNPTHYAVALQYSRGTMNAPTVTAKGVDLVAQKIKEIAGENGVPVIENRPLAQALYREVEIGDEIPAKFYEALSVIIAQVFKMTGGSAEAV